MIQYEEVEEHNVVWCTASIEREGAVDHVVSQGALKGAYFEADLKRARQYVLSTIGFYLEAGGCEGKPMKEIYKK